MDTHGCGLFGGVLAAQEQGTEALHAVACVEEVATEAELEEKARRRVK